jgi:hypothetical protein
MIFGIRRYFREVLPVDIGIALLWKMNRSESGRGGLDAPKFINDGRGGYDLDRGGPGSYLPFSVSD